MASLLVEKQFTEVQQFCSLQAGNKKKKSNISRNNTERNLVAEKCVSRSAGIQKDLYYVTLMSQLPLTK